MEENHKLSAEELIAGKTALAIDGGGILGIGHIGALSEWKKMGGYKNITHVVGSSVGSIVAAAIAAKASVKYMKKTMFGLDMNQFEDNSMGLFRDIYRLVKKWGWNKGDEITKWADQFLCDLTGMPDITMKQLHEFSGIYLTITYWSYRYRKTKYITYLSDPNMKVAEAIRISSSIPVYYQAVWHKFLTKEQQEILDICVDGGTMDNFPLHVLREQGVPPEKILGLKLCGTDELNEYKAEQEDEDYDHGLPDGVIDALMVLIDAMREQAMRVHVKKADWELTCKINVQNLKSTDFDMTEDQKNMLFSNGEQAMRNYLEEVREYLKE